MKFGIIAEGHDDIDIIKQVLKKLTQIDTSDMRDLLPAEASDETDNEASQFSNWELVLKEAKDSVLMDQFFDYWKDATPVVVFHIDTAERGEVNYNVTEPAKSGVIDFATFSEQLRKNVRTKIEEMIPEAYRDKIAYAIAIEETEAWLLPLLEQNVKADTSKHSKPKERLEWLLSKDTKLRKKFVDTNKKRPDSKALGKLLCKNLGTCRTKNKSLDLFCIDIEIFHKANQNTQP